MKKLSIYIAILLLLSYLPWFGYLYAQLAVAAASKNIMMILPK